MNLIATATATNPIVYFDPNDGTNQVTGSQAAWMIESVQNDRVSDLAYVDHKLFIGFISDGADKKGGVAVYDVANNKIAKPKAEWQNISVLQLSKNARGEVFAVTMSGLIEVKADATMGLKLNKAYYESKKLTKTMPDDDITSGVFVGHNLLIGTKNQGLFYLVTSGS